MVEGLLMLIKLPLLVIAAIEKHMSLRGNTAALHVLPCEAGAFSTLPPCLSSIGPTGVSTNLQVSLKAAVKVTLNPGWGLCKVVTEIFFPLLMTKQTES